MAALLDDLETFFKDTVNIKNFQITKDTLLQGSNDAIAIYEYTGLSPLPQVDGVLRSVQVVTASKNPLAARTLGNALYKSLLSDDGIINLTSDRWGLVQLRQVPFKLGEDNQGRIKYVFNMGIITYYD